MSKQLIHLGLLIPILGLALTQGAQAADASLVGWWKLDESTGATAADSSGNGNHATLTGTIEWVEGQIGGGLHLDGATAYGEIQADPSLVVMNQGGFTFLAWFKTDALDGAHQYAFQQGDGNGTGRSWLFLFTDAEIRTYVGGGPTQSGVFAEAEEWYHAGFVITEQGDTDSIQMYVNGEPAGDPGARGMESCEGNYFIGRHKTFAAGTVWTGILDELRIYNRALTTEEVQVAMLGIPPELASDPVPADEASDVTRDVTLAWTPGDLAVTHDVYLGTSFDDVNTADPDNPLDVLISQDQTAATCDPGRLEFGRTYYWRIDEVNGAPDYTVFKGDVWSFTTEPQGYPIENVTVTANAEAEDGTGPDNLVNGSGLNANGQHSVDSGDMWAATPGADESLILEFSFDGVYKLHEMLVWNYNVAFESLLGFGIQTATVEYSADGVEWTSLGEVTLAQAPGLETYTAGDAIDFGGAAVQYVRLTATSGFGTMGTLGLSEVQFLSIPIQARDPEPAVGATDVSANADLAWKAGREAAAHEVYLGTDPAALALVDSVSDSRIDPGPLDLAATYYWRVDEVNEAEAIARWTGNVWSFSTEPYIVVDDFESYNDEDNLIYDAWIDGWINETGSTVGYFVTPFAETTIVHGGGQALPMFYENTGGISASEIDFTFDTAQNWTQNGIQSLELFVYGAADNDAGQLYLKIDNTEVVYTGVDDVLQREQWVPWVVDLAATGADLTNVRTLTLGIEGSGIAGQLFVDDIRLSAQAAEAVE